ncbi:hypothetical protein RHSIM_Rhsim01G0220200 [Rhododendron simsii]|uniref:Adenylate kinase isoenzyme 6 homolog n=1 Tax=Rhododendron simsii TaxID=118357 RepID=A0A834HPR4_RHOSS|nr:hypothetical protein RHSIM_Rhsim01G0220200 [Rhododendron simsii]
MARSSSGRKKPNVLVTGTPGTGKTTTSSFLAEATQLRHVNVGDLVRDKNLHDGWDEQFACHVINEDLDPLIQIDGVSSDLGLHHLVSLISGIIMGALQKHVCDELEDMMEEGGNIVDYHGCDFFPERWFDHVVVLQTENSVLYDRLSKRGYTGAKLTNNIECEIFQVLLEEAKDSYPEDIVVALRSDTIDDINGNVATLTDWVRNWCPKPE